jgi:3-phosphoshikimate 1-carboxyvinyltransferase
MKTKIFPLLQVPGGSISLPAGKSEHNRLRMIQAYATERIELLHPSESADSLLLDQLLAKVSGASGSTETILLDCNNAGTVLRFLLTYLSQKHGKWMLTGSERMKQRPIGALVDALKNLGAHISYLGNIGYPPLLVNGELLEGGLVWLDSSQSSQFATSLMLAAPMFKKGLEIGFTTPPSSASYIRLTASIMNNCGASVMVMDNQIFVEPKPYANCQARVGSDWSAAAFWYELLAISRAGELLLLDLDMESSQGDRIVSDLFTQLGVESLQHPDGVLIRATGQYTDSFKFDASHHPDLFPSLVATCAALGIPSWFSGIANLRIKESDRILAMKTELAKLGYVLTDLNKNECFTESFNPKDFQGFHHLSSWDDHRIAMALAPLALVSGPIEISGADAVVKSYPDFWNQLKATGSFNLE